MGIMPSGDVRKPVPFPLPCSRPWSSRSAYGPFSSSRMSGKMKSFSSDSKMDSLTRFSRTFPLRAELNKVDEFVCENNCDYRPLFKK